MNKYFIVATLSLSQVASAAFLFGYGDELVPISSQVDIRHPQLDQAHLLSREQLEAGLFGEFRKHAGIVVSHIPQTTWDLFLLLNHVRGLYRFADAPFEQDANLTKLNNAFIRYILSNQDVLALYKEGRFPEVSRILLRAVNKHLKRYSLEIQPLYGNLGDPAEHDSTNKIKVWLFLDTHFTQIEPLLVTATQIEQECYSHDQIPFWRHSRTNFSVDIDGKKSIVFDVPLYRALQYKRGWDDTNYVLASGTLSYGFSLLGDFINDGSVGSLAQHGPGSACALSYFLEELIHRVYAQGRLPFYIYGQMDLSPEKAANNLPKNTVLSVVKFPKKFFATQTSWFVPRIFANRWIFGRGEASHPSFRGTNLKNIEKDERRYYELDAKSGDDKSILARMREFIKDTNNTQIIALNGEFPLSRERDEESRNLLANRQTFADRVLTRDDAQLFLKRVLYVSANGIDFRKPAHDEL